MSSTPKTEAQELRELLQGAIADRDAAIAKLAASERARITLEDRNAEQRQELEKLRGEKAQVWGDLLREGDAPC